MNSPSILPCNVVTVHAIDLDIPVIDADDFVCVAGGDTATYLGAYLARHHNLGGVWWILQPGYSPALIARDIATLSHLGRISRIAIVGDRAAEACDIIRALLQDAPVSMQTSFGELVAAVNRPPIAHELELCVGEHTAGEYRTMRHARITPA
jgi:alkanesulfonate monooxygenase SsuD/methylene tetrahydromethanopterin reductase-like flavin-dependent oxidoreductase (luciferase family)